MLILAWEQLQKLKLTGHVLKGHVRVHLHKNSSEMPPHISGEQKYS